MTQDNAANNNQPLILLALNEVNFEYLKAYAAKGDLPNFARVFGDVPVINTSSEKAYHELEPWIQWVSIQTGKTYSEHGIFRLGDMVDADFDQIWEHLEQKYGITTAAVSPMNAANRLKKPAFFIPDPWTQTNVSGHWLIRKLSSAVANAVNENATGRSKLSTYFYVLLGLMRYSLFRHHLKSAVQVLKAMRKHYQRAILLDTLLTDMFISEWKDKKPGFATLFLNGCAHIQHHYMFNSSCYTGKNRNPEWYLKPGEDPLRAGYIAYDKILGQLMKLPNNPRILMATGLHQNPVEKPIFYWRLTDHKGFLSALGMTYRDVFPRMSRDFLVTFDNDKDAMAGEKLLKSCHATDGQAMFGEIENRGNSLFITLTYPDDIKEGFMVKCGATLIPDFNEMVSFVAIKNGEHDGEGYFVDLANRVTPQKPLPITDIFMVIDKHFAA